MDWITLAASAAISTIISTLIGLGVASQTKVIQMRTEERELARREIVEASRELQRQLLDHQDANSPEGRRPVERFASDDLTTAWKFVRAAQRLGWLRRRWTFWLLRVIFGRWVVDRVRLMKDDSSESAVVAQLAVLFRSGPMDVPTGSWHDALGAPSASGEVKRGMRHLRLLELL